MHECPKCAGTCFCNGDIDDLYIKYPEDVENCTHCQDLEDYWVNKPINLKELRLQSKVTQRELCLKTGIPKNRISLIEKGLTMATEREGDALVNFFGKKPGEIEWDDEKIRMPRI